MTGGNGKVQYDIRTLQQRISAIKYNTDGQSRATGSTMGVRNEQVDLISRKNSHYNDRLVRAVKVKRINSQFTMNDYDIEEPDPGNIAVNKIDTNADTSCLG